MNDVTSVQVEILNECVDRRIPVTVFLMNGFQLRGIITNFDASVIIVEVDKKLQMIYRHAISTIVPFYLLESPAAHREQ